MDEEASEKEKNMRHRTSRIRDQDGRHDADCLLSIDVKQDYLVVVDRVMIMG